MCLFCICQNVAVVRQECVYVFFNEASKPSWMNTLSRLKSLTYRLNSDEATVTPAVFFCHGGTCIGFKLR